MATFLGEGRTAVRIEPVTRPLVGKIALPGSKSATNRVLLLAALARGTSRLTGALSSDDTRYMGEALRTMGVEIVNEDATTIVVTGSGKLMTPNAPLFLGNAGTAMRFLTAAVSTVNGPVTVDGNAHMRKRPIGPLVEALRALGVDACDTDGYPPVHIVGRGGFGADTVEIDGSLSSQYVSAILIAAPCGGRTLDISVAGGDIGARGYIDVTIALMRTFGAIVSETGALSWRVEPMGYTATDCLVEPDASAATYLWAAEALTGGKIDLGVAAEDMTQPDAKAHAIIASFPHMPAVIEGSQMQDAIPTLAVLAAFNATPVRFTGIANLRVKECDRVSALSTELARIRPGLAHEDGDDLIVSADPSLAGQSTPAAIHTYADHRIAMSFALAGLKLRDLTILDPGCVSKTYPHYWRDMASLGVGLEFA